MKNFRVDVRIAVPIYEQIYLQIKEQIIAGDIAENEPLPSIRVLAKDLCISTLTAKKGFDKLEKEGWIYTVQGKGSYVSKINHQSAIREEQLKKIENLIKEIKVIAKSSGISDDELIEMIRFEEEEKQ